jgi:hypothetical protein
LYAEPTAPNELRIGLPVRPWPVVLLSLKHSVRRTLHELHERDRKDDTPVNVGFLRFRHRKSWTEIPIISTLDDIRRKRTKCI